MAKETNYLEAGFESRMTFVEGAAELSESRYNLVLGGTLAWGFFLNAVLARWAVPPLMERLVMRSGGLGSILLILLLGYFALVLVGSRMVRSENPAVNFVGFNLIALPVGILVGIAVYGYDAEIVTRAALVTAIIALSMMIVSTIVPDVFASMGRGLGIALLITIVVELAAMFLFRSDTVLIDWAVVVIMSLYIGYDWVRANAVQRTASNAIAAASSLYLDLINIFLRLLSIMSRSRDRR